MRRLLLSATVLVLLLACDRAPTAPTPPSSHPEFATSAGSLSFTNTPLLRPGGSSEPAISIASNGTMAMSALNFAEQLSELGTNLWTGPFGATPTFQGIVDAALQQPSKAVFGGDDADVDFGSTGTLHLTTLILLVNPAFRAAQVGVSAIACPNAASSFSAGSCHEQIIDLAGSDRPWTTSDGSHVFIAYHDAGHSGLIHVQRSDDDGFTWRRVADPIVGQGAATGDATFNNDQGPVVADGFTHNVYDIYTAGEAGIQKAKTANHNNIFVSRSTDGGVSWTATRVFHAPLNVAENTSFPALAVDPTNGQLHAAWSDAHTVFYATSGDQGVTWSPAVAVNIAPANTAVFPWIAAHNGVVDLVYYGTTASSKDDPAAVWNVFLAQTTNAGASFQQSSVSNTPNHVGVICVATTEGACSPGTRNLLDLFEVAIDPANGRAAVIYTDDTITQTSAGEPLPQVVLAQQQ
jgi:hypothetical protein